MTAARRRIPTSVERQVLTETGHRCAVCGEPSPLERAHIIPWHSSKSHNAEDLICLCANCHHRADTEHWGEKTLRVYKQNPWILRSRPATSDCPPRRAVTLRIDFPFESFDDDNQHILVHALAAFLRVSPDDVEIVEIEPGSTLVTVKLPEKAASFLRRAVLQDNPGYLAAVGCLDRGTLRPPSKKSSSIGISEEVVNYLIELVAEMDHERWRVDRMSEGWRYGPLCDSKAKKHPDLVSFPELAESKKERIRASLVERLKGGEGQPTRGGHFKASDRMNVPARIKVIGVGGGGCRAVRHIMRTRQVPGVEYIAVNTDVRSLDLVEGALSVQIGEHVTQGFGTGGDPRVGSRAAEEGEFLLKRAVKDAEMVFIAAGMGGGTGTGAAPVVAKIAKDSGAMVIAVVTTPFSFEGKKRFEVAYQGLQQLRTVVDNMIIIQNDKLLQYAEHNTDVSEAFKMADDVMAEGIMIIPQVVNVPGEINVDMADVKRVMGIPGVTVMAIGAGQGSHPAIDATEQAMGNPLVDVKMTGAKGLLLSFSGGPDLTLTEVTEAGTLASRMCDPQCHFKFVLGTIDEELRGKAKVTLIATGIRGGNPAYATTGTASSGRLASPVSTRETRGKRT